MITKWRIIGIIVIALLIAYATVHAGTKKDECVKYFKEAGEELALDVRYKHTQWYIKPSVWYRLSYKIKEDLIKYVSYCRSVVYDGSERVTFFDGMSGDKLGKMGVAGPKIYK